MNDRMERRDFIQSVGLLAGAAATASLIDPTAPAFAQNASQTRSKSITYEPKPLSFDPKSINGISEKVLVSHYENNYVGAVKRLTDPSVSRYPLPWLATYARNMRDMFAGDPFPFGIEPNRATFEQFLRYTHEQGIAHRHVKVEDIFPRGMMVDVHT